MIQIYHNPRCSKSRQCLQLLEQTKQPFEIIKYLDQPFSKEDLIQLLQKLEIAPIDLVRTQEAIWKEKFKGKDLADNEIIQALINYPKLIERPIVVNGDQAVIGRPPEDALKIV
ncbi:MAG: arsenate reductase (glutaredoxin) [Flavobacteriaceae bacterium]|nr:arsenate reductase (glutaredoxin) [Flavobacteriaceae bacterium]